MRIQPVISASLPEVHASVGTARTTFFRRMLAFAGPGLPGQRRLHGPRQLGHRPRRRRPFGYHLLWVLVLSNAMAILLQTLSRPPRHRQPAATWPRPAAKPIPAPCHYVLWILCEIAIAACDLAEVLGAAIGLNLLFGLPLLAGVVLTALRHVSGLWLSRYGIRVIEASSSP